MLVQPRPAMQSRGILAAGQAAFYLLGKNDRRPAHSPSPSCLLTNYRSNGRVDSAVLTVATAFGGFGDAGLQNTDGSRPHRLL